MKIFKDKKGVVFDIDTKFEDQLKSFIDSYTKDDLVISKCEELPQLQEENAYGTSNGGRGGYGGGGHSQYNTRGGYNRNNSQGSRGGYQGNKAYEIFVGGIPQDISDYDLQ